MIRGFAAAKLWLPLLAVVLMTATSARPQSNDDLDALDKQVEQLVRAAKYAEATDVASRAVAVAERQFGPAHLNVVPSLTKLAWLSQYQGKYDQAEPLYSRALAVREKGLGADHLDVALSQDVLAKLYRIKRRYDDAEQLLKKSLGIREKAFEGEATHGNALWQPFAAHMVRDGDAWRLRSISLLGLAWK